VDAAAERADAQVTDGACGLRIAARNTDETPRIARDTRTVVLE
jgi:hypothetical protein